MRTLLLLVALCYPATAAAQTTLPPPLVEPTPRPVQRVPQPAGWTLADLLAEAQEIKDWISLNTTDIVIEDVAIRRLKADVLNGVPGAADELACHEYHMQEYLFERQDLRTELNQFLYWIDLYAQ